MTELRRNMLVSALVGAALVGSVSWALQRTVVPAMLASGNHSLVERAAHALRLYYADHQEWPKGDPHTAWLHLTGRTERTALELDGGESGTDAEETPETPAGEGEEAGEDAPPAGGTRAFSIPTEDYTRDAKPRVQEQIIVDAWDRALLFDYLPDGSARVVSAGADGQLGTPDDDAVDIDVVPRRTSPTRLDYQRDLNRQLLDQLKAERDKAKKSGTQP